MFHKIIIAVLALVTCSLLEARSQTYDARIAVILPFKAKSAEGSKSLEFYRGMLLAANDMKRQGYNVQIAAYDEGDPSTDLTTTLNAAFESVDLVVGCLYRNHIIAACQTAAALGKKAIFPFATFIPQEAGNCPAAIFTIPSPALFTQQYADMLSSTLGKSNVICVRSPHPHTKSETDDLLLALRKKGCKIASNIDCEASAIASQLTTRRHNLIVTDSNDQDFAERLIETVDATNSTGRYEVSVAGTSGWINMADTLLQRPTHHSLLIPSTWYQSDQAAIARLQEAYTLWFHAAPLGIKPSPALMGYDLGLYTIIHQKANSTNFPAKTVDVPLILNNYHFVTSFSDGCYTNAGLRIIRRAADGSLTLIQLK